MRVGPSSRRASREEELWLAEQRRAGDLPFDQRPIVGSSITDLDLELFRSTYLTSAVSAEVLAENDRPTEQHLSSLRLVTPDTHVPTALGLLTIGFDPSSWIPGAYLQFVRYEGEDPSSPVLDHEEAGDNLIGQLDILGRLLPANIRTSIRDIGGLRQTDAPDYPLAALRELVINAVVHRTYEASNAPARILWFEDRVEITSPGGPYGSVTRENFTIRNDYRNPALAATMKQLGYVNRFGRGIGLVKTELRRNGNPSVEFAIEDTYWGVTVRSAR
ncbi:MAG: ATP-binding protein [Egibacteraceae bacterium]